jgi:hypothetical protein
MGQIIFDAILISLGVPLVIGLWLWFLYLVDDTFFDGRYMDKIRAWNRRKRESEEG